MKGSSQKVLDLGHDAALLGSGVGFGDVYGGGWVYHAGRKCLSGYCAQRF